MEDSEDEEDFNSEDEEDAEDGKKEWSRIINCNIDRNVVAKMVIDLGVRCISIPYFELVKDPQCYKGDGSFDPESLWNFVQKELRLLYRRKKKKRENQHYTVEELGL